MSGGGGEEAVCRLCAGEVVDGQRLFGDGDNGAGGEEDAGCVDLIYPQFPISVLRCLICFIVQWSCFCPSNSHMVLDLFRIHGCFVQQNETNKQMHQYSNRLFYSILELAVLEHH